MGIIKRAGWGGRVVFEVNYGVQLLGAVFRDTEIESLTQVCSSIGKHWGSATHFFVFR